MTDDDIRQALALLDPGMPYDEWVKVGQSIHHETRGAGLHLWDEWSQAGEYPGHDLLAYKWSTFGNNSGAVVTAGTLVHMANLAAKAKGVELNLLAAKPEEFEIVEAPAGEPPEPEPWPVFERDAKGKILPTVTNVVAGLRNQDFSGVRIAHDEFKDATLLAWGSDSEWRPLRDTDYTRLRGMLERRGFKNPGRELVRDGVMQIAEDNRFDSAVQWAQSLAWDGVPRVDSFLATYMGVQPGDYAHSVSRYTWTALAARLLHPGAKCDMVPVLVGGQGTGKSTGVMAMAPEPDAYVEVNLEHRDDNLARSLRGKLVGELGELRGLASKDAEAIKAWITRTHEEWIPKYVEFATKFPRRLLFIGTTNSDEFLADDTGERRWLPVDVGVVDVAGIERDRDQLWAEAIVLFKRDGVQWRDALTLAADKHDDYKVSDPWQVAVEQWLAQDEMDADDGQPRSEHPFKLENVMLGALGLEAGRQGMREKKRTASVLRRLGFVKRRATRAEGGKYVWERAENCTLDELA
jgi:predicted P-loop ATPase